jgi:hypothetical protein
MVSDRAVTRAPPSLLPSTTVTLLGKPVEPVRLAGGADQLPGIFENAVAVMVHCCIVALGSDVDLSSAALDKAAAGEGYFGYKFRILPRQGKHIAGGDYDYGGRCRTRTYDPLIKSQLLYHLS